MTKVLEVNNLTKYYGKTLAVDDLSFALEKGEVFGFIGPNGAGKSTTIRAIMNLIKKNQGTVYFQNQELNAGNFLLKERIGYLPSEIHLYEDYTVKKMLDYHERFFQNDCRSKRKELVARFKIDESKKVEDLSLGNLKKLGIVLAFMHQPDLLILDEPTSGLDPIMQQVFYDLIKEEKAKGATVLYSTHILNEVPKVCDKVGIIKAGKLLTIETIDNLKEKNFTFVTIESKQVDQIIKDLNINEEAKDKTIRFKNNLQPDELIKKLANYNIEKILVEEATLEDIFFHYYQ